MLTGNNRVDIYEIGIDDDKHVFICDGMELLNEASCYLDIQELYESIFNENNDNSYNLIFDNNDESTIFNVSYDRAKHNGSISYDIYTKFDENSL